MVAPVGTPPERGTGTCKHLGQSLKNGLVTANELCANENHGNDGDRHHGKTTQKTVLIAPASMKKQLDEADHFMRPGDMLQLDGFDVLAVPAHNVDTKFHTPEQGWLGYVFSIDGTTFYHAGDTDFLPAMFGIRCDVAFLPVGGHYTMGVEDAARAGEACGAEIIVPVHWGEPHGTEEDIARLVETFSRQVEILERQA